MWERPECRDCFVGRLSPSLKLRRTRKVPPTLCRNEHAQLPFLDLKLHRALADELAVNFDGDIFGAGHAESFSLEIFDFGQTNLRAEDDVLHVLDDLEIAELLENDNVKQAVVNHGVLEKWERPAIKPSITHQDKRSRFC